MIVTCEQCTTQFQLEDSRVPDAGVRVRCSRCKHAFVVKKPTSAGDPVDRAVEQAVDDAPEADAAAGPAPAAASDAPSPFDEGLDESESDNESDWEFNHDTPGGPGDVAAGSLDASEEDDGEPPELGASEADDLGSEVDDADGADGSMDGLLGSSSEEDQEDLSEPSGLEIGGSLGDVEEEIDAALGGATSGMPASALAAEAVAPSPPPAAPPPAAPTPAAPTAEVSAPSPASDDPFGVPSADAAPAAASAELGSPENWDFFDDAEAAPAPSSAPIAIGRIGLSSRPLSRPPVEVDAEPSRVVVWLGRVVGVFGWLVVTALVGAAVYGIVSPRVEAAAPPPRTTTVAGLGVSEVQTRWLDNTIAGPIYVISGKLHNPSRQSAAPGSRLAIRLLDGRGAVVADDVASVGSPAPLGVLRTLAPDEMQAKKRLESEALAWEPLGPGGSRSFQAILLDLPAEAQRFDVVALPAEPGDRAPGASADADPSLGMAPAAPPEAS